MKHPINSQAGCILSCSRSQSIHPLQSVTIFSTGQPAMTEQIITAETLPVKRLESERDEVISAAKDLVIETTSDIEIADSYLVKLALHLSVF